MATCVASQWVDETTPKVPHISGRVVNEALMGEFQATGCLQYRIVK
jgi:hypothetical protein